MTNDKHGFCLDDVDEMELALKGEVITAEDKKDRTNPDSMSEVPLMKGPVSRREEMVLSHRCLQCGSPNLVIQGDPTSPAIVECGDCWATVEPRMFETPLLIKIRALVRKEIL